MVLSRQQAVEGIRVKVTGGKRYAEYGEGSLSPVVNPDSYYREVMLDSGKTLKFNLGNLTSLAADRAKRIATGIRHVDGCRPESIPADLQNRLNSFSPSLRFLWPAPLDEAVKSLFERFGRKLPEDARPIETGKNGGVTELYGLSCDISFPGTNEHIYSVGYGLEMYCNQGFSLTSYAKN